MSSLAMNLKFLDLSSNKLEWLPIALSKLPTLATLILANNSITTLAIVPKHDGLQSGWPKEGFNALETLNLSNNKLIDLANLPLCLVRSCPFLRTLSLANNELTVIPPTLGLIENLTSIDLRGNPQRGIRMNILDGKAPDILSYLRRRIDSQVLEVFKSNPSGSGRNNANDPTICEIGNKIEELKMSIQTITLQLNNVHLTEALTFEMMKTLHMSKATLAEEDRMLRSMTNY